MLALAAKETLPNNAPRLTVPAARFILRQLLALPAETPDPACLPPELPDSAAAAAWLIAHGLGPLAYANCRQKDARLGQALQPDMVSAVAESSVQLDSLAQISAAFAESGLPLVLLKGAALGQTVYDAPTQRTMSDIDIWLPAADMPTAARLLARLGYRSSLKVDRPFALQQLSQGEIRFVRPGWEVGLVETHWSPFPGWWLRRTAAVDDAAIWARLERLGDAPHVYHLAAEDMVIHLAVHTAVNHQFGMSALRSLVDVALTAQKRGVNWLVVAQRARDWRVGTAVYTMLDLLDQLIGADGLEAALAPLKPTAWRLRLLHTLIRPATVLAGHDLRTGWQRYLLLLLLVDRPQDMARLMYRTLWPEKEWLAARYGRHISRFNHWWQIARRGEV